MDGDIRARLRDAVEDERRRRDFPSVILHVIAPSAGIDETFASGYRGLRSRTPITGNEAFNISSVTKTFTATCILRLMERGKLTLEAPTASLLPDEYTALLRSGGYDPDRITARHLLQHTSGLHNHPDLVDLILTDPARRWTPLEWIRVTMEGGDPLGEPGEVFNYCEPGYTLLARIAERATGLPQADAFRQLIPFAAIGLAHTWFDSLEPPPSDAPPQAHQYYHDQDVAIFDPSVDLYGGGGLLSSAVDLAGFFRALFTDVVFEKPDTLETMLQIPSLEPSTEYAMGIHRRIEGGVTYWGHSGMWGTICLHAPDIDLTFAHTRNINPDPEGYDTSRLIALMSELFSPFA